MRQAPLYPHPIQAHHLIWNDQQQFPDMEVRLAPGFRRGTQVDATGKDAMAVSRRDHSGAGAPVVERRKAQRRNSPAVMSESDTFRADDQRLCHSRRWDDWRRS